MSPLLPPGLSVPFVQLGLQELHQLYHPVGWRCIANLQGQGSTGHKVGLGGRGGPSPALHIHAFCSLLQKQPRAYDVPASRCRGVGNDQGHTVGSWHPGGADALRHVVGEKQREIKPREGMQRGWCTLGGGLDKASCESGMAFEQEPERRQVGTTWTSGTCARGQGTCHAPGL